MWTSSQAVIQHNEILYFPFSCKNKLRQVPHKLNSKSERWYVFDQLLTHITFYSLHLEWKMILTLRPFCFFNLIFGNYLAVKSVRRINEEVVISFVFCTYGNKVDYFEKKKWWYHSNFYLIYFHVTLICSKMGFKASCRKVSVRISSVEPKEFGGWNEGQPVNVSLYLMLLSLKRSPK